MESNIILDNSSRELTQERINRDACSKKYDELFAEVKSGKYIILEDPDFPIGKEVWILECGEIPTKTSIRNKYLDVRWPDDITSGQMPWVEWNYEVKGKRCSYFSDKLYGSRRDAELARAKSLIKTFASQFGDIIERNEFSIEDFPELNNVKDTLKLLG